MKINKMNTGKYLIASTSILIAITILMFVSFTATSVFSVNNDSFNMTVDIVNTAPYILASTMAFNDTVTGDDIVLTASSETNLVYCNATASDVNGWQDIVSASANLWHSSSTVDAVNDKNVHYSAANGVMGVGNCNIVTGSGSGNDVPIVCQINLEHEATDGTWTCNITVIDSASATGSNVTTAAVAELVAMTVSNDTLDYGDMSPGATSSSLSANVTNEGNHQIGVLVNGTNMTCSITGNIPIATNIKYDKDGGDAYAAMAQFLTDSAVQVAGFTLVPEGIAPFPEDQVASQATYWAINVPLGVKGSCVGDVTVTAIAV
jgi:hypothetical protein